MPIHAHWRPLSLSLFWKFNVTDSDSDSDRLTDWQTVTVTVTLTELYCFIVSTYLRSLVQYPFKCQLSLLPRATTTDAHWRPLSLSLPWKFDVTVTVVVLFHCINLFKGLPPLRPTHMPIMGSWQLTRLLAGWPGLESIGVYWLYCIVLYCIVLYCIVFYCIELNCIVYCIILYCIDCHCKHDQLMIACCVSKIQTQTTNTDINTWYMMIHDETHG